MSRPFRDLPIRRKLTIGITATSVTPLLIAAVLALGYGFVTERAKAARDLRALAETLAVGAKVQLEFGDQIGRAHV